jgi:hypothetical protein
MNKRISASPSARASTTLVFMQNVQPFICEARNRTNLLNGCGNALALIILSTTSRPLIASGVVVHEGIGDIVFASLSG